MQVFRIAKTRHINDLSGTGARLNGGRWNHPGIGILYTSPTRALATVEFLVHVPAAMMPRNLGMVAIEIPDPIVPQETIATDLPENWRRHPAPPALAEIGSNWALSNNALLLRVPSAVVEHEYNILINPAHPDMRRVTIVDVQPYIFDNRLMR